MMSPASSGSISIGIAVRDREEKPVAMQTIVAPLLVGAEVGHGGLDLDYMDRPVGPESDNVRPSARRQAHFRHGGEAE